MLAPGKTDLPLFLVPFSKLVFALARVALMVVLRASRLTCSLISVMFSMTLRMAFYAPFTLIPRLRFITAAVILTTRTISYVKHPNLNHLHGRQVIMRQTAVLLYGIECLRHASAAPPAPSPPGSAGGLWPHPWRTTAERRGNDPRTRPGCPRSSARRYHRRTGLSRSRYSSPR